MESAPQRGQVIWWIDQRLECQNSARGLSDLQLHATLNMWILKLPALETMATTKQRFAVCIDNRDYEASLILRKIYEIVSDEDAAKDDFLRVIDESGEDYLYHSSHFVVVEFPAEVEQALISV